MAESARLVDLVQAGIDQFLDDRKPLLSSIAPELETFIDYSRELLQGGKRFRALFCYWGWQSTSGPASRGAGDERTNPAANLEAVLDVASALEIFHAAALVHDDIMDNSDTRRGMPAAHRRFESLHSASTWSGSATAFGSSGALLLGDLLLGWSDELFDNALRRLSNTGSAAAARREFNTMRTEVTLGQYLDIVEEQSWDTHPEAEHIERAHKVIVYKSAKYSVEAPLAIGASLGGGTLEQLAALRAFGIPLGTAFQLRDDLLGAFGDAELTGKPSGDDLREGKRTVLIALARAKLPANARRLLDELLGDPELTAHQVAMLQASIRDCGAVEHVERIIDHNMKLAIEAISDAPITPSARDELIGLADRVIRRAS
ncbi:MAG: polyprenyl synthetase family protein [Lacisediminihabitans sp.]